MKHLFITTALLAALTLGTVTAQEADPPVDIAADVAAPAQAETAAALAELRDEVGALRSDLRQLQETLDYLVNQVMADLETENLQLRDEVRRIYNRADAGLAPGGNVPRPGGDAINQVLSAPAPSSEGESMPQGINNPLPAQQVPFAVVNEWGRSPEVAAELPGEVPSLVGLVGVVPPASRKADVEQLGRELRAKYDAYDNILIEVFDNEDAAIFYAETRVSDPVHRVLSISKDSASGRDVITLLDNGVPLEIAY